MYGDYFVVFLCFSMITIGTGTDNANTSPWERDTPGLFIVISENNAAALCNPSMCNTLAYFMKHSPDYFRSNQVYQFQAGSHHPWNDSVNITGVSNLTLQGPQLTSESAVINCSGAAVTFHFRNSSIIIIKDLTFYSCAPGQQLDNQHGHEYSVLYFLNNTDVYLWRLGLSNSVNDAFFIKDTIGDLQLKGVEVTNSNTAGKEIPNAGNTIAYSTCTNRSSWLLLEDSIFKNNSNLAKSDLSSCPTPSFSNGHLPQGGGLSIRIECDNIYVNFSNVTMSGNVGGDGGNLELLFDRLYSMAIIHVQILNSRFESGYGLEGGGIRIVVLPIAVPKSSTGIVNDNDSMQCSNMQSSKQYRVFLRVINTTFSRNEAVYAGAGVYVMQKQAIGLPGELGIVFYRCAFINNDVCKTGFGGIAFHSINYHVVGYHRHQTPQFRVIVEQCDFHDNYAQDSNSNHRSRSGTGVVFSKLNDYFELNNSQIYNNNSTGVLAISSNVIASGSINITNNRWGSSGGGILLCQNAVIYFNAGVTVTIANNSVKHVGGGICVETECRQSKPPCFFQLVNRSLINTIHVNVSNNSALFAGNNLFGGSIDYCYMIDEPNHKASHSLHIFSKLFNIVNNTVNPLSVTSSPLAVCLCDEHDKLFCDMHSLPHNISKLLNLIVYRGEKFHMKVAIVGQQNGLVPGTVHAWLKGIPKNVSNTLDYGQSVQKVGQRECYWVTYSIRTTHPAVTLQLGVEPSGDVSGFELLHQYKRLEIDVTLKDCPVGFIGANGSCVCNTFLSSRKITCNIRYQTISNVAPSWIGFVNNQLVYQKHCPSGYCQTSHIKIHVHTTETTLDMDEQCAHDRTGIMCGKCAGNLSVVFGTYKCKQCSNYWLLLLIVWVVVGVIIVLLLTVLDLTVSEGTLGGLIFYCNIVKVNFSTFFQGQSIPYLTSALKLFISLFNFETGYSSCLFNGMDMYARNWLSFGFPLYLWLLTGVVIYLSRSYSWIVRRNAVRVLATLILLSYAQSLMATIEALQVAMLYKEDGHHEHRWLRDGSLTYFEGKHVPLGLFALLFGLLLLPFAFALLFIQCFQSVSHHYLCSWVTYLKPLFDAYTGPFNANTRFWTGLLLIVRIIILIASATNTGGDPSRTVDLTLLILVLLLATSLVLPGGLYRKHCLNLLEMWLLINLVLLSASVKPHFNNGYSTVAPHLLVGLAFLTAVPIFVYHISKINAIKKVVKYLHRKRASCSVHVQSTLDWNDDVDRYQVENSPCEDREPLLAASP